MLLFAIAHASQMLAQEGQPVQQGEMAGYLIIPNQRVPDSYDAGFSMYVAAWPLLQRYPGQRFQSGLPGTWMFAKPRDQKVKDLYSDIEGGLGWWRDTEYATETPKFIMGGVAPNFSEWANGPGAGMNRDWSQSFGKYGVAQLSPWLLWPPDGLNLRQGMRGQLLGYGYLPLPLTREKPTTAGKPVPTGSQCWTLFLNSGNFKGPVAFFTPFFWSRAAIQEERFVGELLDSRPSDPQRALQMETQHIPSAQATDAKGVTYARVAPVQFPSGPEGMAPLVHQVTSYQRRALWDSVQAWFAGGPPSDGRIDPQSSVIHAFADGGYATWQIYVDGAKEKAKVDVAWDQIATPAAANSNSYGYRWNAKHTRPSEVDAQRLIVLPEYYRLDTITRTTSGDKAEGTSEDKRIWTPVHPDEVPADTHLAEAKLIERRESPPQVYATPEETDSVWKTPGPKAGPFQVDLGDGSRLTYYWYRFAEQPALMSADLSADEREELQAKAEKLHANWKKDREYLPPPQVGQLAELDPALIVTPPAGMEVGYVPIVTRQEPSPHDTPGK